MKYKEDKRVLRRIEHTAAGLVFTERRFRGVTRPLLLNKRVLHQGEWKECTLNWMPIKKCWNLMIPVSYGFTVHMKTIARVKQLKEVWAIVIDMGHKNERPHVLSLK